MNEKEQELNDLYEERYHLLLALLSAMDMMDVLDDPYDSDVLEKLEDVNSRIAEIELSM